MFEYSRAILQFESNVNSVTSGESDGGIIGDIGDQIKDGIVDGFAWLGKSIIEVAFPVLEWGCRFVIIGCVIMCFCGRDEKRISTAIKFFLIYIVLCFLEGLIK